MYQVKNSSVMQMFLQHLKSRNLKKNFFKKESKSSEWQYLFLYVHVFNESEGAPR